MLLLEELAGRTRHHLLSLVLFLDYALLQLLSGRLLLDLRLRAWDQHEDFLGRGPILRVLVQASADDALKGRAVEELGDLLLRLVQNHLFEHLTAG